MNSFCDKQRCPPNPTPAPRRALAASKHITGLPFFPFPPSPISPLSLFLSFLPPLLSFLLSLLHFLIKQWQDSFLAVSQEGKSLSNLHYFQLNNFLGWGGRGQAPGGWNALLGKRLRGRLCSKWSIWPNTSHIFPLPGKRLCLEWTFFPLRDKHEWLQLTAIFFSWLQLQRFLGFEFQAFKLLFFFLLSDTPRVDSRNMNFIFK